MLSFMLITPYVFEIILQFRIILNLSTYKITYSTKNRSVMKVSSMLRTTKFYVKTLLQIDMIYFIDLTSPAHFQKVHS